MIVNFALNLTLIWPLAEVGLAVSTSVAAMLQVGLLSARFSRSGYRLDWPSLGGTLLRTVVATASMSAIVATTLGLFPKSPGVGNALIRVALPLPAGLLAYLAVYWLLGQAFQPNEHDSTTFGTSPSG